MQINPISARVYSLEITNEPATSPWGGCYMSNVITVPIGEAISTSSHIFVSYVNSSAPTAFTVINSISEHSVNVRLLRFSPDTLSGTINVMVA